MCECVKVINGKIEDQNMRIKVPFLLEGPTRLEVVTEKIDKKKRGSLPSLFTTFCPFCGVSHSTSDKTASGVNLVANERQRQIDVEGYDVEHDDQYAGNELPRAAACYCLSGEEIDKTISPEHWPWLEKYWKPTPNNRIKELVKAGALIVAEIERLQREESGI